MKSEDLQKTVKEHLERMGCTDVVFPDPKEDLVVATFNCKEVTSFVSDIEGWTYSGIQLDPTNNRQFKIDFRKLSN